MEVKYSIDDNELLSNLNKEYGIQADSLHFIPMGDSAYSYRVHCIDGQQYYLKLFDHKNDRHRKSIERLQHYLPLTWQLYHQGPFRNITYPIKKQNGDFKTTFKAITTVLFNFIEGETLAEAYPFSKEILENIAKSVVAIQQITPFIEQDTLLIENFDISFEANLEKCVTVLEGTETFDNPLKHTLREVILLKKEQIYSMLHLIRELRVKALADSKEMVLCHGDIWGGNLICHENELYFVDWESAMIAPLEFNLFGYIGDEFEVFFSSYEGYLGHSVTVNIDILRFYCYRHHLRNLTNWLMNLLYRNVEKAQDENDLEMILYHCMNRWDSIEPNLRRVACILQNLRKAKDSVK